MSIDFTVKLLLPLSLASDFATTHRIQRWPIVLKNAGVAGEVFRAQSGYFERKVGIPGAKRAWERTAERLICKNGGETRRLIL